MKNQLHLVTEHDIKIVRAHLHNAKMNNVYKFF